MTRHAGLLLAIPVPQAAKRDAGAAAPTDHFPLSVEDRMADGQSFKSLYDLLDDLNTHGECRFDPDLHTGPDSFEIESPADRLARETAAREVCGGCPVRDLCLDYVLRLPVLPTSGIWAGLTADEIAVIKGQARRQSKAVA